MAEENIEVDSAKLPCRDEEVFGDLGWRSSRPELGNRREINMVNQTSQCGSLFNRLFITSRKSL